jgi:ABC-type Na+ efflux pump permease subunit
MRTKTRLLAIFVIVTAIAVVTAGSITASTLAVKKEERYRHEEKHRQ